MGNEENMLTLTFTMRQNLTRSTCFIYLPLFINLLVVAFSLLPYFSHAQYLTDTAVARRQEAQAADIYYESLKTQSGIYNGSEYVQYTHLLKEGHPYFDTTQLKKGAVFYNRVLYTDVPMLYDIIRDELVAQHFNKVFLIQLIKSKIDWFDLYGHRFEHLGRDSTRPGNVRNGFYDLLYNGKVKMYVKRVKMIQETIPDMQVERKVYANDRYFIFKDSIYHEVNSQASVMKVLPNHNNELKQAVRSNKIRFRKNREYAIKLMVQKYDALN